MIKDIFDDREQVSMGFFHYSFWAVGLINSVIVSVMLLYLKEHYYLPKAATELGAICMGIGFGIVLYRVGVIAINDIISSRIQKD